MLRTTLAGLLAHKVRLLLTAIAITLGVSFIAGTFVLTDTMEKGIRESFSRSADNLDLAVFPHEDSEEGLPADLLARIQAVPGVSAVAGTVRGQAPLVGRNGKVVGSSGTAASSIADGRLAQYEFAQGRAPKGGREAVLDAQVAEREKFKVGDTITVLDHKRVPHRFALVGLVDTGADQEAAIFGLVGFDQATTTAMTGERTFAEIDVIGGNKATVGVAVGQRGEVLTGAELADQLVKQAISGIGELKAALLLFGLVSMLVSALVIYNTFAILIAQRMREMALLRCVGSTRRQIFGGVLLESAVVGLIGSVIGLAVGLGLGAGVLALLDAAGAAGSGMPGLSASQATLTPRTMVAGLLVGVVVTVLSAMLPARAATKVAPVAALGNEPEPGTARFRLGWKRIVLTGLLGLPGLAAVGFGALVMEKGASAMFMVALGGALVFLAVVGLMPALIRPLGGVVGGLPARFAGMPGRLAVENARRSPRRTATTTIALTIGVGLMSLFAVVTASAKTQADVQMEQQFPVDLQVSAQLSDDAGVPHALTGALRARPELGTVIEQREARGQFGDDSALVSTVGDGALGTVINPRFESGSARDLRPGSVVVAESTATSYGLRMGQTITLTAGQDRDEPQEGTGRSVQVTVAGIFDGGTVPVTGMVVTGADFDRVFTRTDPSVIYVKGKQGVPAAKARVAAEAAARPYPTAQVVSQAEIKAEFTDVIDAMLKVVAGLLALAILIALFGIANTLTLSVVERTRESALLRALGVTRRQLRWMLSIEALVMAVIGALTGVVLGAALGWAVTQALMEDMEFAAPFGQIAAFIALAGVAGVLASVLPARRAAGASIVASLSHD